MSPPGDAERRPRREGGAGEDDRAGRFHRTADPRQIPEPRQPVYADPGREAAFRRHQAVARRAAEVDRTHGFADPELRRLRRWLEDNPRRPVLTDESRRRTWAHLRTAGLTSEAVLGALLRQDDVA